MGRSSWVRAVTLALSGLVAVGSALVLIAYGFERLSFEPTASDNYWVWVLSGLAPWAGATLAASVTAIVLSVAPGHGPIAMGACAVAVVIAVTGIVVNLDRLSPNGAEGRKVRAFADSARIRQYRTSIDTTMGYPVGVIEWSSSENPQELCTSLGADLSAWADSGSVAHPVGGGPQASSPGVPCRWIATSGGWPVSGQVSLANTEASVRVEVAPPGTQ